MKTIVALLFLVSLLMAGCTDRHSIGAREIVFRVTAIFPGSTEFGKYMYDINLYNDGKYVILSGYRFYSDTLYSLGQELTLQPLNQIRPARPVEEPGSNVSSLDK